MTQEGPSVPHHTSAGPDSEGVLPPWLRYPLIVLFAAFVLTGLVILLYDRGWLPLAGPFVAVIVASALVYVVMWSRSRRVRRLGADAVQQLQWLTDAIAHERTVPMGERPTGASDESLEHAATQAELAMQRLAWGHEQGAGPFAQELVDTARRSWREQAPMTREAERLSGTMSKLDELIRRMVATAERRQR